MENIVTDTRYDGLGHAIWASQAREVSENSTTFYQYKAYDSDATMRWTKTSFDLAGRTSQVNVYDPTDSDLWRTTSYAYAVTNDSSLGYLFEQEVTDANSHATEYHTDSLGRLRKVVEGSGTAATTRYTYDSLDQLTQVSDASGNLTKMVYDSLGRKTRMEEPNMGGSSNAWTYAYWGDGTLWRQTDARNQSICFYYDAMDRLTKKDFVSGATCSTTAPTSPDASYGYDSGSNGKGRRTSMSANGNSTTWTYDGRGRVMTAAHTVANVAGSRTFAWTYDSADRVKTITYPPAGGTSEVVTYTYDAAWRQSSVCGTACYVSSATYNALSQPVTFTFGNTIFQNWTYTERALVNTIRLGTSSTPTSIADRAYTYDGVGNVTKIKDNKLNAPQVFRYDTRDRLIAASAIESTVPSGTVVTVRARGDNADGWPTMELRVNGALVKSWPVNSASWANYTHTLTTAIHPGDTVDIVFTNNYGNGTLDRNLYVDYIQFGSIQTIQAESRAVSYDRNTIDGQDVIASDGNMWWSGGLRLTQLYSYNNLGNLTHKEGAGLTYGTQSSGCADGALNKPHALVSGAGKSYCYDRNGNMVSGGGRSFVWNGENLPTSITSGGVTESYGYTADSARVKVVRGSTETIFLEGLYEEIEGGAITKYYTLNGGVVAMREHSGSSSTVTRLHGDHLGSVSVATSSSGVATQQEYDPWGQIRPNAAGTPHPISQTRRNYTGQIRDDTGLLYYNARYYDPTIGRFLSADSVVPGNPSGGMDGVAITPLTIDFHEGGFLGKLNAESAMGFWFELSNDARRQHGSPMGPANPQSLNRYSYVQNNPLRYVDPTGHCPGCVAAVGWALSIAGFTVSAPIIAAIAAVVSVSLLAVFLSDAGNRDWLATQLQGGVTNLRQFINNFLLMARKDDLRYIDYLARKYNLTREQRRRLHDEITKQNLSREEIREIAEDIANEGKDDDHE
ncbi:MAG: hypothetical protein HC822_10390 [Oscillochloris sp.]|nr:hypothetical protein [Oscillochloris sp.]